MAAVTYGLVMIAISISFGSMWVYIGGAPARAGRAAPGAYAALSTFRFVVGNAGYVAGTLIALVAPVAALIIFGLLAVYYLFEHLPDPSGDGDAEAAPDGATGQS